MKRTSELAWVLLAVSGCNGGTLSMTETPKPVPADAKSGGAATAFDATSDAYSNSIDGLSSDEFDRFDFGHAVFSRNWVTAPATTSDMDGLGPLFNARACSGCHSKDGSSPPLAVSGAPLSLLFRLSIPGESSTGGPNPEPVYGDQLRPFGILGVPGDATPHISYQEMAGSYGDGSAYSLQVPSYTFDGWNYGDPSAELYVSPRMGPPVMGLGLLEAVPETEILANVHEPDADGVHGVPNYVWDATTHAQALGRFGWKANQPSTLQQTAGAFVGDIGITSSLFPHGSCSAGMTECLEAPSGGDPDVELDDPKLQGVAYYMKTLAVPARRLVDDPVALHGEQLFQGFGCSSCHLPTLHTAISEASATLSNQTIHPYTDLLLHDMGPELADGRPDFQATGSQWRTSPLWGVGLLQTVNHHSQLLHDGRARGIAEAILWHGGEGTTARERFRLASSDDRSALLRFLESL